MNYDLRNLKDRGDTIVEVLIAIGLVTFVLVTAYTTVSYAARSIRDGQERQEALAIAQSQVELIRQNGGLDTSTHGCFDGAQKPAAPDTSNCAYTTDGVSGCTGAVTYCYKVATSKTSDGTYQVTVAWESLLKNPGSVALWYRPGAAAPVGGSGPGGGGTDGDAEIDAGTCDGPGLPACPRPGPGGSYYYTFVFINQSDNPPANIVSCTWDWGDGSPVQTFPGNNPICHKGNNSPPHTYPTLSPEPSYPAACVSVDTAGQYFKQYTAALHMTLVGGITKTDTREVVVPNCY